jgi:tetratricopeptide (TPR) repeat protein
MIIYTCLTTQFHQKINSILIAILFSCALVRAAPPLPADMHSLAIASIESIYREDLKSAEESAKKIIKKYPDYPAGYFFMAVVLDAWMVYYQSEKKENEFYQYCDRAIEKGEVLLDNNPKNEWARFFIGGADGYKGTYEARFERWITAFRYGWKGVSVLMELETKKSTIDDIYYGIGSYDYWRSAMMKILWWMPGINDNREEGIKKLYRARDNGIYTKTASSVTLIDIFINENRYKEALAIAEGMLKEYQNTLVFHWGKAKALYGLKRYNEAEGEYKYILSRVEAEPFDNHYNAVVCHYWLAKIEFLLERYTQCIAECNRMGYYDFDSDVKKRLEKYFNDALSVKKQALAVRAKNYDNTLSP